MAETLPTQTKSETTSARQQGNGFGITSLVMGILSIVFILVFSFFGILFGILGIVFAIIQKKKSKSMLATVGLILSSVGLGLSIAASILGIWILMNARPDLF